MYRIYRIHKKVHFYKESGEFLSHFISLLLLTDVEVAYSMVVFCGRAKHYQMIVN